MKEQLHKPNRILIIGESGRGKTTLSKRLHEILGIPSHSTDDFYWKVKFTERNNKEESIKNIFTTVYSTDSWIVEGSSTHLWRGGLDASDLIVHLGFKNIFQQWVTLIQRNKKRDYESFLDLIKLLTYVTRKRFNLGYKKEVENKSLLEPYGYKIKRLRSYREINDFVEELTKEVW